MLKAQSNLDFVFAIACLALHTCKIVADSGAPAAIATVNYAAEFCHREPEFGPGYLLRLHYPVIIFSVSSSQLRVQLSFLLCQTICFSEELKYFYYILFNLISSC